MSSSHRLRVIVVDDERPARAFLIGLLEPQDDVEVIAQAGSGTEAVELIERLRPDLVLLDLHMPELDGLGVVRLLRPDRVPLIAFVTAYDAYALQAFELNAVDYLLKPVEFVRLRRTINRAIERLESADYQPAEADRVRAAAAAYDAAAGEPILRRIPVRTRDHIALVPVEEVSSVVADGELLHLTTVRGDRHTISHRLKDLEARLDPAKFIRLSRGTLVNIAMIERVTPMPAGTYVVVLRTGQQFPVSRLRSRVLRDQLLRL
ncbi:MAG: LytR/AlgR family response regulator transcription factor [Gemmatimonadaceae bacterium]